VASTACAVVPGRPACAVGAAPGAGVVCRVGGIAVVGDAAAVDGAEPATLVVVPAAPVSLCFDVLAASVHPAMTATSTRMAAPTPLLAGWRRDPDQNRDHRDVPATLLTISFVIALRDDHRTAV
jgi:hypothetical protein